MDQSVRRQRRHPQGRRHTTVRLSDEEERALRALAETAGVSLPRYLVECGLRGSSTGRAVSLREQRQLAEQLGTALVRLRRIGAVLNQLAARLNSTGEHGAGELAAALAYHRETVAQLRSVLQGTRW